MSEERLKILNMLADGKISATEADKLLSAISEPTDTEKAVTPETHPSKSLKYLRILVEPKNDPKGEKVNIQVPFQLLRAGMKLKSLMPEKAQHKIDHALKEKGVDFDLSSINASNMEELVQALADMKIDVDNEEETVRIFCE